jgi:hypothetical protein
MRPLGVISMLISMDEERGPCLFKVHAGGVLCSECLCGNSDCPGGSVVQWFVFKRGRNAPQHDARSLYLI